MDRLRVAGFLPVGHTVPMPDNSITHELTI